MNAQPDTGRTRPTRRMKRIGTDPATLLAAASSGWIIYGATTGWGAGAIGVAVAIWVGALTIAAKQANKHNPNRH